MKVRKVKARKTDWSCIAMAEADLFRRVKHQTPEQLRNCANAFECFASLTRRLADLKDGRFPAEARN
jgi:hypothetical protein